MKVEIGQLREDLVFSFFSEDGDRMSPGNFSFGDSKVSVGIGEVRIEDIHPDLVALSTILMCHPFVGERIVYPLPVSREFKESMKSVVSRYDFISESKEEVSKRVVGKKFRMGLAYSGGVDSNAALSILPKDTVPVFMLRPERGKTLYNPDAALESCNSLSEVGYDVKIVSCDVEYLRDPVGFPTDLANAIPAILLSDELQFDSISFGTVLESAFGIGHEKYRKYGHGAHWKFYGTLFETAGVTLSLPVSGISEVGTAKIVNTDAIGQFSQSCIRGVWGEPCMRCWKCFRKGILNISMGIESNDRERIGELLSSAEVRGKLSSIPISHEDVIEYSMQRFPSESSEELELLRKRVDRDSKLEFLEKWYPPSIEFIHEKYRREVKNRILSFIEMMDSEEIDLVEKWDMTGDLSSEQLQSKANDLVGFWRKL